MSPLPIVTVSPSSGWPQTDLVYRGNTYRYQGNLTWKKETPMTPPADTDPETRFAIVSGLHITGEMVARYLPANYRVVDADITGDDGDTVIIEGIDVAGWTLDAYIIPRLASGLLWATEVECRDDIDGLTSWGDEV